MSTDKDWEKWGKENPYFGVLSAEKFKGNRLKNDVAEEFYALGTYDIKNIMEDIKKISPKRQKFNQAVDFGCGVGRLTIPLAAYAKKVTGLDVSPSMVRAARKSLPKELKNTVTYAVCDDELVKLPKTYDFVYSYIVLQHIPVKRGMKIMDTLLARLEHGGVAALHITFCHTVSRRKKVFLWIRENIPYVHQLANIAKNNPINTPLMRMHTYDLGATIRLFDAHSIRGVKVTVTDHGGYIGAMIVGQKNGSA